LQDGRRKLKINESAILQCATREHLKVSDAYFVLWNEPWRIIGQIIIATLKYKPEIESWHSRIIQPYFAVKIVSASNRGADGVGFSLPAAGKDINTTGFKKPSVIGCLAHGLKMLN